jgi:hypothetical protein
MTAVLESRSRCPYCGSHVVIAVVYGYPSPEMLETEGAGDIELGGCVVIPGGPTSRCKTCGHGWHDPGCAGLDDILGHALSGTLIRQDT